MSCTSEIELDFEPLKHHEDSGAFQNQFSAHVSQLKTSSLANPFKLNKLTLLNSEKATSNDILYDHISKMLKLGEEQFKAFWMDRVVTCKIPVSDPILLNSLYCGTKSHVKSQFHAICLHFMLRGVV